MRLRGEACEGQATVASEHGFLDIHKCDVAIASDSFETSDGI